MKFVEFSPPLPRKEEADQDEIHLLFFEPPKETVIADIAASSASCCYGGGKLLQLHSTFPTKPKENLNIHSISCSNVVEYASTLTGYHVFVLPSPTLCWETVAKEMDQLHHSTLDQHKSVWVTEYGYIVHSKFAIRKEVSLLLPQKRLLYILKILGFALFRDSDPQSDDDFSTDGSPECILVSPTANRQRLLKQQSLSVYEQEAYPKFNDNMMLYNYLENAFQRGTPFVIPRVQAGPEHNVGMYGHNVLETQHGQVPPQLVQWFGNVAPRLKNNAGIRVTSVESCLEYARRYMKAFENCDVFGGWEPHGGVYQGLERSQPYIVQRFQKRMFWACAFDIFHYTQSQPWTHALRGKRLLIVSPFETSFREKLDVRAKLYDGVDLFPDCTFVFLKPPQTQADEPSEEFDVELERFQHKVDALRAHYDVALVSAGGYGNLICNHLFETGKSAIYVGGVLQMYFGVSGMRWLRERPDVLRLFLNTHWSRPKAEEKPKNFRNVEDSCYW